MRDSNPRLRFPKAALNQTQLNPVILLGFFMLTQEQLNNMHSLSDVCRHFDWPANGTYLRKVKEIVSKLDCSHFRRKFKYKRITKVCPVCSSTFETQEGHIREKTTCSYACSNTYFRSGKNNANWRDDTYRSTCFLYHKKICVVCSEDKIVEVHHLDEDKSNNDPSNLVPLCPTHHQYWHSRYKDEVESIVINYIEDWKSKGVLLNSFSCC